MTRWRIAEPAPDPVDAPLPAGCVPHRVVRPDGSVIRRLACKEEGKLCPCLFDALLAARVYTWSTSLVCSAIREKDGRLMGRTGPKRSKAEIEEDRDEGR